MSAQSLFSKKNIEAHQPDARRGLMEELNLPPELISFIRKNSRILQICLAFVAVLVLCWVLYDYYTGLQESRGASLLASAMQVEAIEEQQRLLENVVSDYSGTNAASWARIELAHHDYQQGKLAEAAAKYETILADLSKENPLLPLVRMNLAQSFEEVDQYDRAIAQYNLLKQSAGFKELAHLALARIYRAQNDPAKARREYEDLLNNMKEGADPQLRSRIQAMLTSLGSGLPAPMQQSEENQ